MVKVIIPVPLRRFTGNRPELELEGGTVREVVENLESAVPGLRGRLLDDRGRVRRFMAVFLNGNDIGPEGSGTPVEDGDEVALVPGAAGG